MLKTPIENGMTLNAAKAFEEQFGEEEPVEPFEAVITSDAIELANAAIEVILTDRDLQDPYYSKTVESIMLFMDRMARALQDALEEIG